MANELLPLSVSVGVQRAVRDWVQSCDDCEYLSVTFEDLPENDVGLCVSTDQAPAYVARYINGGYKAEYRFRLIYRVLPSDDSDMLDAVEFLSTLGSWCETTPAPTLDDNASDSISIVNEKVTRTSDVAVLAAYEDGTNDYGISFTISWEVF